MTLRAPGSAPVRRAAPEPVFVAGDPDAGPDETARRLLLVSYHFPPSGAVGGLRWQEFSRWLATEGWRTDVVTLAPGEASESDPERLGRLPAGVRVFGAPRSRLVAAYRRLEEGLVRWRDRLGRLLFDASGPGAQGDGGSAPERELREPWIDAGTIPRMPRSWSDLRRSYNALVQYVADRAWTARALRTARRLARSHRYDAVVTSGPPHGCHLAGLGLVDRVEDLPWVMDLRDPWSLMPLVHEDVASPLWRWLAARDERRCVEGASLVVCNTARLRREMCDRYDGLEDRSATVMNGYDPFEPPDRAPPAGFRVVYAGSIYADRDPRPFLRAVRAVVGELSLGPSDFAVELLGNVFWYGGIPMRSILADLGLERHVSLRSTVPRSEALEIMGRASVLLSLPQEIETAVPSKVFEYMNFRAWILALARRGSATEELLRDTPAAVLDPDDVEGMARWLEARYREFRASGRPAPVARSVDYGRRRQAEEFRRRLEAVVSSGDA